jgi:hypothetical protein
VPAELAASALPVLRCNHRPHRIAVQLNQQLRRKLAPLLLAIYEVLDVEFAHHREGAAISYSMPESPKTCLD